MIFYFRKREFPSGFHCCENTVCSLLFLSSPKLLRRKLLSPRPAAGPAFGYFDSSTLVDHRVFILVRSLMSGSQLNHSAWKLATILTWSCF